MIRDGLGKRIHHEVLALLVFLVPTGLLMAQGTPQEAATPARAGTPLEDLLKEAEANNPRIRAAQQAWDGARMAASQISDPLLQPLARAETDLAQQNYEAVRRALRAELKEAYLQLAAVTETLDSLETEGQLLTRLQQASDVRYRSGMGNQQDMLRAQLEQTKYLAEISHHDLAAAKLQYRLKQILNRSPSFSDVTPVRLSETTFEGSYYDLWAAARGQNPELTAADRAVETQRLRAELAHRGIYPFFDLQYERAPADPSRILASYRLALAARTPLDQGPATQPSAQAAITQAEAELLRAHSDSEGRSLDIAAELGAQYTTEQRTRDLLRYYREGLLPQATALAESALAAYQDGRLEFGEVLSASLEISRLNGEYWQILADHETALARIEEMTGLSLRSVQALQATTP
jgi:outer membrane protein TolC